MSIIKEQSLREIYVQALLNFDSGAYPQALRLFNRALNPHRFTLSRQQQAYLLFNIGLTHQALGQTRHALQMLPHKDNFFNATSFTFQTIIDYFFVKNKQNFFQDSCYKLKPTLQIGGSLIGDVIYDVKGLVKINNPHIITALNFRSQLNLKKEEQAHSCSSSQSAMLLEAADFSVKNGIQTLQQQSNESLSLYIPSLNSKEYIIRIEQQDLQQKKKKSSFRKVTSLRKIRSVVSLKDQPSAFSLTSFSQTNNSFFIPLRKQKSYKRSFFLENVNQLSKIQENQFKLALSQFQHFRFRSCRKKIQEHRLSNVKSIILYSKCLWRQNCHLRAINHLLTHLLTDDQHIYSELGWMQVKYGDLQQGMYNIDKSLSINSQNHLTKVRFIKAVLACQINVLYQRAFKVSLSLSYDHHDLSLRYITALKTLNFQQANSLYHQFKNVQLIKIKACHQLQIGHNRSALKYFKELTSNQLPLRQFAKLLFKGGHFQQAKLILQQLISRNNKDSHSKQLLIQVYLTLDQVNLAVSLLEQGLYVNEQYLVMLIEKQIEGKHLKQALKHLTDVSSSINYKVCLQLAAKIYFHGKNYGKAIRILELLSQKLNREIPYEVGLLKARTHMRLQQWYLAAQDYLLLNKRHRINSSKVLFQCGVAHFHLNDFLKAQFFFQSALSLQKNYNTLFNLAKCSLAQGHQKKALLRLSEANLFKISDQALIKRKGFLSVEIPKTPRKDAKDQFFF